MVPDVSSGLPLTGKNISLTSIKTEDLKQLEEFFNHIPSLIYYLPTTVRPFNQKQIEKLIIDWNDGESCFVFAIRSDDNLIGLINLDDVDWVNSHSEIGIALTEHAARGRGYASEALELMTDYAFNSLGLHKLWARIIEGNQPSIRLFEQAGFINEGTMREHVLRNGKWKGMLIYGLINNSAQ
jgi:RimJ/RimL family protein N-acetyltransferase